MGATKPPPSAAFPNGAGIAYDVLLRKFSVVDADGVLHGYRNNVDVARELAASLPGEPREEPKPAPIPRSPHALPLPPTKYLPNGVPRDERVDFFETIAAQAPRVITAFERSRALSRRQAAAHDRVFGRHRGKR